MRLSSKACSTMIDIKLSIETKNLRKVFENTVAVDSLDLTVTTGSITALLGGNGAGKSLLQPTSGSISILGHDLEKERDVISPYVNFSSPYVDLPNRLTVKENLTVYGHLYGILNLKDRISELAEHLQIENLLNRRHGSLSAGQRTRASLAKSLLNSPRLLLLDEPTASLDPDTADWVRTLLMDYRIKTGATIFLSSHNMYEVERMCDDVIVMKEGRIVARGTTKDLLTRFARENLEEVFLDIARNRA
jgi:ABC-2 type transport system ATP-binding protein